MPVHRKSRISDVGQQRVGRAIVETLEKRVLYAGDGLQAAYYASADLSGPAINRLDPQINFNWKHAAPAKGVSPSPMSVRWTGDVVPPVSGRYTFVTAAQGSVRLTLNGQTVINDWRNHRLRSDRTVLTLTAGQKYALEIDYAAGKFPAMASFYWTHKRQSRQVVPTGQLYSGPANPASDLALQEMSGDQINLGWQNNADNAAGFRIERSADGGPFVPVTTVPAKATTYTDTQAPHGVTLAYQVVATNVSGDSPAATAAPLKPPAPTPAISLDASGVSGSQIDVTWKDATGYAAAFIVERSTDNGQTFQSVATVPWPTTVYHDTGLTPNTNYSYRVVALNDTGTSVATYPLIANTLSGVTNDHPEPTRLGWANNGMPYQNTPLPNLVSPDSERPGNIFYVGQTINFTLEPALGTAPGAAKTYEVRDYYGNLVDSGAVAHPLDLTLAPEKPGWYKLYLYGAPSTANATFGDVVGGTTFSVFRNNPNLPGADWLRLGQYNSQPRDFQPAFTRTDGNLNFTTAWSAGTPDATQIPAGPFAVRWTGQLRPTTSGTYTLSFGGSAGWVRLWLNGVELIDASNLYEPTQTTVQLQAGQAYNLRIDYFFIPQTAPSPAMVLSWSGGDSAVPMQPVPQAMLYSSASSQASSGDGLSATYYKVLLATNNTNDQVVRAITDMGPQRYQADASNPTATIQSLSAQISFDSQYYTPLDPQRNKSLLISFGTGTVGHLSGVTQIVQQFQNQVEYWEPQNEPNDPYPNGADFVPVMRDFYNTVKAVNPNLKVIGPGVVTIGLAGLNWLKEFFAAGGGQYLDVFSFHAYNNVNRDLTLVRESFAGLKALLNQYGLGHLPLWQTEQGYMADVYGDYEPQNQAEWTMLEMMAFEQNGLPKEQNVLWFDKSNGFLNFPAWWENGDGSLNPAAPLMRVWSEELYGTNFTQAYDFGPAGNNTYIGSLFSGPGKSVAAFMTGGAADGKVTLNVSGGSSLHVIDAFGNASDIPVVNGQATLGVGLLPEYVEMASGQTITVVPLNWGPDLATQPGVTALADGAPTSPFGAQYPNPISLIHDGVLQNWYYTQDAKDQPWIDNSAPGAAEWVELDLPSAQSIDHVVIRTPTPWQNYSSLLDYELQFQDANGRWVTIQHVQEDPKTFGVYTPETRTTVDSFYSERSIFTHSFSPVVTSKIRLVVNNVTWGGGATQESVQAGGQTGLHLLSLQEIEVYGN